MRASRKRFDFSGGSFMLFSPADILFTSENQVQKWQNKNDDPKSTLNLLSICELTGTATPGNTSICEISGVLRPGNIPNQVNDATTANVSAAQELNDRIGRRFFCAGP